LGHARTRSRSARGTEDGKRVRKERKEASLARTSAEPGAALSLFWLWMPAAVAFRFRAIPRFPSASSMSPAKTRIWAEALCFQRTRTVPHESVHGLRLARPPASARALERGEVVRMVTIRAGARLRDPDATPTSARECAGLYGWTEHESDPSSLSSVRQACFEQFDRWKLSKT